MCPSKKPKKQPSFEMYSTRCTIQCMARPPKAKHLWTPLRLLRSLLTEQGEEAPMSQLKFSQLIDVPVSTIKAIENGQRSFSHAVRVKIRSRLFAVWNRIRELGVRQFKRSGTIQLSAVQGLSTVLGGVVLIPETDPEAIKLRIDGLFTQVPKQSWMKLYRTIQECLEAAREDLGLEDLKDLFKTTKDEIHFSPTTFRNVETGTSWTSKPLQRTYGPDTESELKRHYWRCEKRYAKLAKRGHRLATCSDFLRVDLSDDIRAALSA